MIIHTEIFNNFIKEEIIKPLEKEGILVPRSRDQLEKDMPNCVVLTRDGTTLACGMLKKYSESQV
jgi:amino-acid N-acetyltransferase